MLTFDTLDKAIEKGNQLSNSKLKSISVYIDNKTKKFIIFLSEESANKHHTCHVTHTFKYLCTNFVCKYHIGYKLHKDSTRCVDSFPTLEAMNIAMTEKRKNQYVVTILTDEKQISKYLELSK